MCDDAIFHPPTAEELSKAEFRNPIYLQEIAGHLVADIEQLKKEVIPMRDEIRFLIQLNTNFADTFQRKPIRPNNRRARSDLSSQITELNILLDELNAAWQEVRTTYSSYSKNMLMQDILDEQKTIHQMEDEIKEIEEYLNLQKMKTQMVRESEVRYQIRLNQKKEIELNHLLDSLKIEEEKMLENFQESLNNRPTVVKAKSGIKELRKKLEIIKHTHMRKEQDLAELKARYDGQKQQIYLIQAERERQRKEKVDLERRIAIARERALKEFEARQYPVRVEPKKKEIPKNYSGPIPNKANPRLFDEEKMNSIAKQRQKTYRIHFVPPVRPTPHVEQTFKPEPPKQRYHHHRRAHRKHHHDDPGPYVFTTSDPMNGPPMHLISTQDEEDYDNASSENEEEAHADYQDDFQSDN